ncbi:MAG: enoyl-CoA hydratase-related protein [Hyphomicrobiales bacterium]
MTGYTDIQIEIEDPVAVIRLNRPEKLNAFTYHTLAEIRSAVDAAAADPRVVGIVITGNGRGFCAGLDSAALAEVTSSGGAGRQEASSDEVPGLFTYFLAVPKPIIAAVNGVAVGGGLVLAAMCDLRFASANASFATVFLKRGLIAEHGTTWILPRLVGAGRALDLLWRSERIDAARALEIGLVEFVSEPERLLEDAKDYVRELAAQVAPQSIADTKRLVYAHMGTDYPTALREADAAQWAAIARPDAAEGARALLEKRPPNFRRLGQ